MPFKTIMVALNGVAEEDAVIKKSFQLADALGAKLQILHVNELDAGSMHMMMDYFPKTTSNDLKERIKECGFEEKIPGIDFLTLTGKTPVEGIVEAATDADLLVMGHHKKNLLISILTDSVDDIVNDRVDCPVLMIPVS
jgi:nucleotide-binding universal stress UspA family protein